MSTPDSSAVVSSRRNVGRTGVAGIIAILLISARASLADEAKASLGPGSSTGAQPAESSQAAEAWGPVQTGKASIANVAPLLLPFFNNGPVFGLPGTVVGDFRLRTQLTGDWGGLRKDLTDHGVFVDLYSVSTYQNVLAGGLATGSGFFQNTQLSLNLDTGRAGLWPGGLFHFTLESRYGDSAEETFTVGSSAPQHVGLALPGPFFDRNAYPTEYFLVQALTPRVSVLLGKLTFLNIADQTLFGDSYKYYFANFNFNKDPIALSFYNTTTLALAGLWTPAEWLTIGAGVFDPNSQANNLAKDAFDHVNLYTAWLFSYTLGGLPGQLEAQYNRTTKPKIDLASPFGPLTPAQVPQAVGVLLGSPSTAGLPINHKQTTWGTITSISQYLFVMDDGAAITPKLKSGQPLQGVGLFARFGYSPERASTVAYHGSMALFAHGLFDRKYDSFGAGYYYNAISGDLKNDFQRLTAGTAAAHDEQGIEVFYDLAITPAIRLIPSYQHIWHPLVADVSKGESGADVFLARVTMAF